jgi:hypothetical protein
VAPMPLRASISKTMMSATTSLTPWANVRVPESMGLNSWYPIRQIRGLRAAMVGRRPRRESRHNGRHGRRRTLH